MSSEDKSFERVDQKSRTRAKLLRAARQLIEQGHRPSVAEVADHAGISRATTYRYFATPEELIAKAALYETESGISVKVLPPGAGLQDVYKCLDQLVEDVFLMVLANERVLRASLALTPGIVPVMKGRQTWLRVALAPLHARIRPTQMDRLVHALSLLIGVEALIVLRDECGVSFDDGVYLAKWAARALVDGALVETF